MTHVGDVPWPNATKKRKVLALYLDYLLFGVPWSIAVWILTSTVPGLEREPWGARIVLFALLEWSILKFVKSSPGQWLLGIRDVGRVDPSIPIDQGGVRITKVVEPWLKSNERWWIILFGVLAILNGSKSMVRWTMWGVAMPFFGIELTEATSAVVMTLFGMLECAVGIAALRLKPIVLPLGVVNYGANLVSIVLSWPLLPQWIEEAQRARRQAQRLPVRPGKLSSCKQACQRRWLSFL